jgi:hypothetical protein
MVSGNGKVSSIQSRQNERYSEFLGSNYKGKKRVQAWDEFGPQLTLNALKRRIMKKIRRKDREIEADDAFNLFIKVNPC